MAGQLEQKKTTEWNCPMPRCIEKLSHMLAMDKNETVTLMAHF